MKKIIFFLLLFVSVVSCHKSKIYVSDIDDVYYRIDEKNDDIDTSILSLIAPYKEGLKEQLAEVLTISEDEFVKAMPNGTLNNFIADALYNEAKLFSGYDVDFAIQNYGGIRIQSLPKGDINIGKIYELMPFDNKLIILKLNGALMVRLLDRIAEYGGWPISKSLSFGISKNGKASDITINGMPFDKSKTYSVALPDYIANGGDSCDFLEDVEQINTGMLIRDLLIHYFRRQVRIRADFDKRIKTTS